MGSSQTKDISNFTEHTIDDQIDPSKLYMLTLEEKKEIVLGKKEENNGEQRKE